MSDITEDVVKSILSNYTLPYLKTDPVTANAIKNISISNELIKIDLQLGMPIGGINHVISEEISSVLKHQTSIKDVLVNITSKIISHSVQNNLPTIPKVKNVIAVGSGKGGVGKSTVAVNLALALKATCASVGLIDADIYGSSQPTMLGCKGVAGSKDGKTLEPLENHGIQCISMGHLLEDDDTPVIWRGPMATSALQQLINDVNWRDLDYLIVDLPPGTGDVQLTLCQKIPLTGAVIVTTPQDIALLDARKALKMFDQVYVTVLGVVENMSNHICTACGHEEAIFGSGGGEHMAELYGVPLLGQLPLDIGIREGVDSGIPSVISAPTSAATRTFTEIARQVAAKVAGKPKNYTSKMPKIVIENKQ